MSKKPWYSRRDGMVALAPLGSPNVAGYGESKVCPGCDHRFYRRRANGTLISPVNWAVQVCCSKPCSWRYRGVQSVVHPLAVPLTHTTITDALRRARD